MTERLDLAQLKMKKRAAQATFGSLPGVEGFGVGDGTIRVYLRSRETEQLLPSVFDGVPLELVVTGDISAY